MMHRKLPLVLLLASMVAWADPGSVTRATELKDKPFLDANTIVKIAADTKVDIQSREGAWAQVKTSEGKIGWLKVLNLRSGVASSGSALGGFGQIVNVARTGSSGNTVTTGVKGLSAEQIKNATPNITEVEHMKSYGVSSTDAQRFATASKLSQYKVAAIEVPKDAVETPQQNRGSD